MMPFLAKIADRLLDKFPESMEGVAVVLPSKRAVVFLKNYLSKYILENVLEYLGQTDVEKQHYFLCALESKTLRVEKYI